MFTFADYPPQGPTEVRDYTVNFDTVLEEGGERLTSVTWFPPAGITLMGGQHGPTLSSDRRKATVWVTGGTSGESYLVRGHFVTDHAPPREDDFGLLVVVR